MAVRRSWGIALFAAGSLTRAALAQEPQMATLIQPLAVAFEQCRQRVSAVLKAQGYAGFLEFGNGWSAHARGTAASVACIPQNGRSVLVIVTAGGQLVKESTRLFEEIRGPAPAPPRDSTSPAAALDAAGSGWSATATGLASTVGSRYNFWCPPHGVPGAVWGDLVYAAESSVCAAAVHAGTLSVESGGNAIIEMRAGQPSYAGSSRNGIVTQARGPSQASFVFVSRSP